MPVNSPEQFEKYASEIRNQLGPDYEKLARFFNHWATETDFQALHQLEGKYFKCPEDMVHNPDFIWSSHQEKFMLMAEWFLRKYRLIQSMQLDALPPQKILDLGAGAGHFLALAGYFGHQTHGLDLPNPLYNDLCAFLGIDLTLHEIQSGRALPEMTGPYDLVTAQLINFNSLPDRDWNEGEWAFFLRDLTANQMKAEGRILLQFNMRQFREGGLNVEDGSMERFIQALGGRYLEEEANNEITYYGLFNDLPRLRQRLMMFG